MAGDRDLLGGEELGNFMFGSIGYTWMFLVKVLTRQKRKPEVEQLHKYYESRTRMPAYRI